MVFTFACPGPCPPPNTPLEPLLVAASPYLATVRSPKYIAFPVVAMVMYWITLEGPFPPPNTPLEPSEVAARLNRAASKSPKSMALLSVAMVM